MGLTEAKARDARDVVVATVRFDETARTIIDGETSGFCKLIADRTTGTILGCHVVGERAVEIVQVVAIAIAAGQRVEDLTQGSALVSHLHRDPHARCATVPAEQIHLEFGERMPHVEA